MTAQSMYGMSVIFRTFPGKREELLAILLEASREMATVKGCFLYIVSRDEKEEELLHVFEAWRSKEDHDRSLTLPGSAEMIARAMPLLSGKPEGTVLQVAGGKGL